eukprot:s1726_g3.t1
MPGTDYLRSASGRHFVCAQPNYGTALQDRCFPEQMAKELADDSSELTTLVAKVVPGQLLELQEVRGDWGYGVPLLYREGAFPVPGGRGAAGVFRLDWVSRLVFILHKLFILETLYYHYILDENERYQEAFNIAQEANRTLAEARQAVAKVRAARGYFDPAGMKGSTKGASKGKGKMKGKRTSYGPCFICGSMQHGYLSCPDRFSAKGGSPSGSPTKGGKSKSKGKMMFKGKKGKPGKSPSRVNYAMDYVVDIEKYQEAADDGDQKFVNVMSLQSDNATFSIHALKAIIDTGATESVCGVTSMARMLDFYDNPVYHVVLHDRPMFRFGNGQTQQATSRLDIETKALKMVSFYLLDGQAEMTPPLLGGRELWNRNAVVAYCGEYFAHQDQGGAWWTNPLIRLRGRHVAIDLNEQPQTLSTLLNQLQLPPSEPGDDDEGNGDDDNGGGGPGPGLHRRSANDRRRGPGRGHGGDGGLGVHEAVRRAANRSNAIEDKDMEMDALFPEVPGGAGDDLPEPESPLALEETFTPAEDDDVIIKEEINPDDDKPMETAEDDVMIVKRQAAFPPAGLEPTSTPCRIPWCGGRGCRHGQMRLRWSDEARPHDTPSESKGASETPAAELNPDQENHEPNPEPMHESLHTGSAGSGEHHEVHEHDRVDDEHVDDHARDDRMDSVLMISTIFGAEAVEHPHGLCDGVETDANLKHLAQRLQKLKNELHGSVSDRSPCHRSQTDRMAMSWQSPSWSREIQPVWQVDNMHQVRTTHVLRDQGEGPWRDEISGSDSRVGDGSARGTPADLPGQRDEREDLPRKSVGDQGQTAGDQSRSREPQDGDQGRRSSCRCSSGGIHYNGDCANKEHYTTGYTDEEHYGAYIPEEPYNADTNAIDSNQNNQEFVTIPKPGTIADNGGCQSQSCTSPSEDCREGSDRDQRAPDAGLAARDGRDPQRWQRGGRGRLADLWSSLMALRERMSSGKGADVEGSAMDSSGPQPDAGSPNYETTFTNGNNFDNHQTTCTTSTTASDTTMQDILSVKNTFSREILPPLAKKLAKAATLSAIVVAPVTDLFRATEAKLDLMEVACSPTSTLTETFEKNGFSCERINHLTGYDLDTKRGTTALAQNIKLKHPRLTWISLPCTRLSSLQNLTERDEEAWTRFLKRRGQDLRRADEVAQSLEPVLEADDFGWEWPIGAVVGWRSHAIQRLQRMAKRHGRVLYWVKIHGCQYGLTWKGFPLKKGWMILTTSKELYLQVNKRCPGNHEHAECRGDAAKASSYYPPKLCQSILNAIQFQWKGQDRQMIYLTEKHLLNVESDMMVDLETDFPVEKVMALSRTRMDLSEAPKGKKLEAIKQLMMRVHRAAGHPGFSKLQELLRARGSPAWAVELAGTLE